MRLAYFSPLNPIASGISDYSEELLPFLAKHLPAEITLVVDGYTPANQTLTARFPVVQDNAYDARNFDLALYQLGNSPAHAYIYRRAVREPGVVVLHDLVLHHLVAWMTINHGDRAGYIEAMREAYGEAGAQAAERDLSGLEELNRFDYPLSERVLQHARGVIAHSRYVVDAAQRIAPRLAVAQIPHEMPNIPPVSKADVRKQLGFDDALLVGSFGNLGPSKRITVLFDAFRAVRSARPNKKQYPDARLVLVGATSPNFDMEGLIELFTLRDAVQRVGPVSFEQFHTYIAAMDVCVNLRYPTAGETSGAVLRMMAQAKPVIVSRVGWFAELPNDAVAHIDVDAAETDLLQLTLERLLRDAPLRAAMGENARQYVLDECGIDDAARAYADFIQAVSEQRAESKSYSKRSAQPIALARPFQNIITVNSSPQHMPAVHTAPDADTSNPAPPDWRDELADACVALGFTPEDAILEEVARAVVALGLSEPPRGD